MSKIEAEAMRVFVDEIRHARRMKARAINLAKEDPRTVLQAIASLPDADRKTLAWVARIAEQSLGA